MTFHFCLFLFSVFGESQVIRKDLKSFCSTRLSPPGSISFDTQDVEAQRCHETGFSGAETGPRVVATVGGWLVGFQDALEKSEEAEAVTSLGIPSHECDVDRRTAGTGSEKLPAVFGHLFVLKKSWMFGD